MKSKEELLKDPKEREAYNQLTEGDRIVAEKLGRTYQEHLNKKLANKGKRHPADYWITPKGGATLTDPITGIERDF